MAQAQQLQYMNLWWQPVLATHVAPLQAQHPVGQVYRGGVAYVQAGCANRMSMRREAPPFMPMPAGHMYLPPLNSFQTTQCSATDLAAGSAEVDRLILGLGGVLSPRSGSSIVCPSPGRPESSTNCGFNDSGGPSSRSQSGPQSTNEEEPEALASSARGSSSQSLPDSDVDASKEESEASRGRVASGDASGEEKWWQDEEPTHARRVAKGEGSRGRVASADASGEEKWWQDEKPMHARTVAKGEEAEEEEEEWRTWKASGSSWRDRDDNWRASDDNWRSSEDTWKATSSKKSTTQSTSNSSLDSLVGQWRDLKNSYYTVSIDEGGYGSTCSVVTTRPSGACQKTKALIRVGLAKSKWAERVTWGNNAFVLEPDPHTSDTIRWASSRGGKDFLWYRCDSEGDAVAAEEVVHESEEDYWEKPAWQRKKKDKTWKVATKATDDDEEADTKSSDWKESRWVQARNGKWRARRA